MPDSLTLTVPADPRYRVLGAEVVAMYGELAGGSADDGKSLSAAVSAALDDVVAGSEPGAHADLTLRGEAGRVEITVSCGSQTRVVAHSLPSGQHPA